MPARRRPVSSGCMLPPLPTGGSRSDCSERTRWGMIEKLRPRIDALQLAELAGTRGWKPDQLRSVARFVQPTLLRVIRVVLSAVVRYDGATRPIRAVEGP